MSFKNSIFLFINLSGLIKSSVVPLANKQAIKNFILSFSLFIRNVFLFVDNSKFKMPKNYKWAFSGDVYVLVNNRSASSSERVITFMKYNPRTKIIGTHSSGCLQYTNYRFVRLSGSGISIRLPLVYKEVPHAKPRGFEMHGFEPDILCKPGTDAFSVAMNMISKKQYIINTEKQQNYTK